MTKLSLLIAFTFICFDFCFAQPKAVLVKSSFDFGTVAQGTVIEHAFEIQNKGDQPLVVTSVKTTCGCTAAVPPGGAIQPGLSAPVTVSFDSTGFSGPREKTVRIYTNDPETSELQVSVQGTIQNGIEFSPKRVQIGEIRKSDRKMTRLVYVSTNEKLNQKIKSVSSLSDAVQIKNDQIAETGGQFQVEIDPSKLDGVFMERVVVTVLDENKELPYVLPVYGKVVGSLIIEPKIVAFGMLDPNSSTPVVKQVKIASPSADVPLQIKKFDINNPSLTVTLKEVQKNQEYIATISAVPSQIKKDIQATLSVVTSDTIQPTVNVTVYGVVPQNK